MQLLKQFMTWLSKLDEYDKQAKQMRREDRLGEYDYSSELVIVIILACFFICDHTKKRQLQLNI